jgi:hypothetical protein
MYMNSQFLKLKKILSITAIFINATFVRDAQTIQKFKIIHVFNPVMNEKRITGCI